MLVVAAVREELGLLPGEVLGVGPIAAAVRAGALVESRRPTCVVLVGTAGAYPGGPAVGTLIAASRVGMSWGVSTLGLGYMPLPLSPVTCDDRLLGLLGLETYPVLTTGCITTDPDLAHRLADGWTVEHLEAFSVAHACREVGIPFVAVLGITNQVGPNAHAEWLANRSSSEAGARGAVLRLRQTLGAE